MAAGYAKILESQSEFTSMSETDGEVTQLLKAMQRGEPDAADKLLPLVYSELHRLARSYMRKERPDHTLQPTALINEAYLRLAKGSTDWQNRAHFIGVAAIVMRRILVDHAKAHLAAMRGGKMHRVEWEDVFGLPIERSRELVALDDVLPLLEKENPRQAKVVELHYHGGFTFEEIGKVLNISPRTAKRDWDVARGWMFKEISKVSPQK
jgi:RNA polymerase sigma-70 factor (ECF subfamily)